MVSDSDEASGSIGSSESSGEEQDFMSGDESGSDGDQKPADGWLPTVIAQQQEQQDNEEEYHGSVVPPAEVPEPSPSQQPKQQHERFGDEQSYQEPSGDEEKDSEAVVDYDFPPSQQQQDDDDVDSSVVMLEEVSAEPVPSRQQQPYVPFGSGNESSYQVQSNAGNTSEISDEELQGPQYKQSSRTFGRKPPTNLQRGTTMSNIKGKNFIPFWSSENKNGDVTPNYKMSIFTMMIIGVVAGLTLVRETMGFKAGEAVEEQTYAANEGMHHVAAGLVVLTAIVIKVLVWAMVHKCCSGTRVALKGYGADAQEKQQLLELENRKHGKGTYLQRTDEIGEEIDQPARCNPVHLVYPPTALKTGLWLTGIEVFIAAFVLSVYGGWQGLATAWKVVVDSDFAHDVGVGIVALGTTAAAGAVGFGANWATHRCFFGGHGDQGGYEEVDGDDEEKTSGCCASLCCGNGGDE